MPNVPNPYVDDQIVHHAGSHARVLAGPGTGKTDRLTYRCAWLIRSGINPKRIVCVTFTRAAAGEMKQRLSEHPDVGPDSLPVVMNLHALALMLLSRLYLEQGSSLVILDSWEEKYLLIPALMRATGRSGQQGKDETEDLLKTYEAGWNSLDVEKPGWTDGFDQDFARALAQLGRSFGFTLRGELVYRLKELFDGDPIGVRNLGFTHVMVDEFQDLNPCDIAVIDRFAAAGAEVMVCGDDDQSIYGFRQAHPISLLEFPDSHRPCQTYELTDCYRCPQNIVQYANATMEHSLNHMRYPKRLRSASQETGMVQAAQFQDGNEEAEWVAAIVGWLIRTEGVPPGQILVLCPTRSLGNDRIVPAICRRGIKVRNLLVDNRPIDSETGRRAYSVLRYAANQRDAIAVLTWLYLFRNIGPATVSAIEKLVTSTEGGFPGVVDELWRNPGKLGCLGTRVSAALSGLHEASAELKGKCRIDEAISFLATMVAEEQRQEFIEYLERVAATIGAREPSLADLVSALQTFEVRSDPGTSDDHVRVMTMHKAKGLTARAVILPGMEDQFFLGEDADPFKVEEIRRLFYMSITRSRKYLFLTHARKRYGNEIFNTGGVISRDRRRLRFLSDAGFVSVDGPGCFSRLGVCL